MSISHIGQKNREIEQDKALKSWLENGKKGSAFCCTGWGKTVLGIKLLKHEFTSNSHEKWRILVPTTALENQWKVSISSWGLGHFIENGQIDIQCVQSAYKQDNVVVNGLIVDEVHLCLSPEYRKAITNVKYDKILALTATAPEEEEYNFLLKQIAPVIYEMTLDEAVGLQIVSPYQLVAVSVPLNPEERDKYEKANRNFVYYKYLLGEYGAFDRAKYLLGQKDADLKEKKNAIMFYKAIRDRGDIVKNAAQKIHTISKMVKHYSSRRIITFGETNALASALSEVIGEESTVYHSSISQVQRAKNLEAFLNKEKRILCSTKALNAGFDDPTLSMAILGALNSKSLPMIQRIGRTVRFVQGKIGLIVVVYVKNSQEEKWLKSATENLNIKYLESINQLFEEYA